MDPNLGEIWKADQQLETPLLAVVLSAMVMGLVLAAGAGILIARIALRGVSRGLRLLQGTAPPSARGAS